MTATNRKALLADVQDADIIRMKSMFRRTWGAISADAGECSAADVRELVSDAGRYKMHGDDPEAAAFFDNLSFDQQEEVLQLTFTANHY